MKLIKVAVSCLALVFSGAAMAGPAWTFVDIYYTDADGSPNQDVSAYGLNGSLSIGDLWHVAANYQTGEDETAPCGGPVSCDFDSYEISAGIHPAATDNTDVYAEILYGNIDPDATSSDADYFGLGFGVRSMISDNIELNAGGEWAKVDDIGTSDDSTEVSLSFGGRYSFSEAVSVGLTFTNQDFVLRDSDNNLTIDVRWAFGDVL